MVPQALIMTEKTKLIASDKLDLTKGTLHCFLIKYHLRLTGMVLMN